MKQNQARQVASILGTSIDGVRLGLEQGVLPFGSAIQCNNQFVYVLFPEKVKEYLGIDLSEEEADALDQGDGDCGHCGTCGNSG